MKSHVWPEHSVTLLSGAVATANDRDASEQDQVNDKAHAMVALITQQSL